MRLLYILGNIINRAGVERIMTKKINYLAEAGYDISLLTTDQNNQPLSFPISPKVNYIAVNAPIPSRKDYHFFKWLLLFYKARSLYSKTLSHVIKEERPDIIICTTYSFDVLDLLVKICHKRHSKLVIESHIHRTNVFMEPRLAYNPLLSEYGKKHDQHILNYIKKAAILVCLTHKDMDSWKQLHVNNVCVIPNMITINPPKSIDYSSKRVIAVGRYSHQKGFDMLIKAWGKLTKRYTDWHLYIYGNEDRAAYEEMAKTEKCQKTCHCMPVSEDITSEYGKSSIFVMSSRYEGMPLVLIEAMSSGLACISFNCPNGPSDIINDGVDGFLAKNGDIEDLVVKMDFLMNDESLRNKIGIIARKNIERYSPQAVMQQNLLLYNSILNLKKSMIQEVDRKYISKIAPDFIYNRFDLFCNNYIVLMAERGQEKHIIEARLFDNYAELGIWKMHISNELLKNISDFLFYKYSNIGLVKFFFCDTTGYYKPVKHFSIYLPDSAEEFLRRRSSKSRHRLNKQRHQAEREIGSITFKEFKKENCPKEIIQNYNIWKEKSHHIGKIEETEAYFQKYHISDIYVLYFGNNIAAIMFSCEQCSTAYLDNFSFNIQYSRYSPGQQIYEYVMTRLIDKKFKSVFLAGGDYDYKRYYGSIEETLYDGFLYRNLYHRIKHNLIIYYYKHLYWKLIKIKNRL